MILAPGPIARGLSVSVAALLMLNRPAQAPWAVLACLLLCVEPLLRAYRAAHGTALRASLVWTLIAVGLGLLAETLALFEPLKTGRPLAGLLVYLATLATLAALISVLNARAPGGGAWAVLMALLIVVFLFPWLEGVGFQRPANALVRLRLDPPWTIFYGLLVLAGVTNFLPTRYGLAAAFLGLGFVLEFLGLTQVGRSPAQRSAQWMAVPWTLAAAIAIADIQARKPVPATSLLNAAWFFFRDHWGVVWALRVSERFNRSAASSQWLFRLTWQGVEPIPGASVPPEIPDSALTTFQGLIRRFVVPERLDAAIARSEGPFVSQTGPGTEDR